MTTDLYDRVRKWTDDVNITSPLNELACMVEEFGELDEAIDKMDLPAIADAIGDSAVCLISNDYLLRKQLGGPTIEFMLEYDTPETEGMTDLAMLGRVAEGCRKPKKVEQSLRFQSILLNRLRSNARTYGFDFEKDCLGLVVPIIESRVATGKNVGGSWVKAGDL